MEFRIDGALGIAGVLIVVAAGLTIFCTIFNDAAGEVEERGCDGLMFALRDATTDGALAIDACRDAAGAVLILTDFEIRTAGFLIGVRRTLLPGFCIDAITLLLPSTLVGALAGTVVAFA